MHFWLEIKAVLTERTSVWDMYNTTCQANGTKVIKKCKQCTKSQMLKDAERCIAKADEMGQEDMTQDEKMVLKTKAPPTVVDGWCYMYQVLSLQENFLTEKPMIQSIIEEAGHVCLFLPWFHCKLNTIELLWGFGKHHVSTLVYLVHAAS